MKLIPLTQGKFAQVDDEDYEHLMQWKWHAYKSKRNMYAGRSVKNVKVSMHRYLLNLKDFNDVADHKNNDGLDNQRCNLRVATRSQNGANRRSHLNSSSKYLGVSFNKDRKKWKSEIKKKPAVYFLGWFENEIDAAKAYNIKAFELFGDFANLNKLNN